MALRPPRQCPPLRSAHPDLREASPLPRRPQRQRHVRAGIIVITLVRACSRAAVAWRRGDAVEGHGRRAALAPAVRSFFLRALSSSLPHDRDPTFGGPEVGSGNSSPKSPP
eukprot:scaffold996_cov409-Prasinococcus_capsulatus_cf.AAC.10